MAREVVVFTYLELDDVWNERRSGGRSGAGQQGLELRSGAGQQGLELIAESQFGLGSRTELSGKNG